MQIITNGFLVTESIICRMKEAGVGMVSVSVDGTRELHDEGRMQGSYERCEKAFGLLRQAGIMIRAVTTVTAGNFSNLSELKQELLRMGVRQWGIQLGLPYGNFAARGENEVLPLEKLSELIDFCDYVSQEGTMAVFLGDNIGYYSGKESLIRSRALCTEKIPVFMGCPAVRYALTGDIFGENPYCVYRQEMLKER